MHLYAVLGFIDGLRHAIKHASFMKLSNHGDINCEITQGCLIGCALRQSTSSEMMVM